MKKKKRFHKGKEDPVFKMTFCTKESKYRLINFLRRVYRPDIKDIVYEPIILNEKYINTRKKFVDLLVTLDSGEIINLEVNTYTYSKERNFCYLVNQYANVIEIGENYNLIPQHVQLNITWGLEEGMNKGTHKIVERYRVQNEEGLQYVNNLEIIEINMDKIMEGYYNKDEEIIRNYKELIMLDLEAEELSNFIRGDEVMESIGKRIEQLNQIPKAKWIFTPEEEDIVMENTLKYEARQEGLAEGRAEGRAENQKEVAINLFKNGVNNN